MILPVVMFGLFMCHAIWRPGSGSILQILFLVRFANNRHR
jgi:hypothetical protein